MSGMFEQVAYRPFKDIPLVTSLPSNPNNGDMIVLTDSLTAGTYHWHLRYVSARSSNKWVFVGGAPGFSQVNTSETTASGTYAALATAGPSFAIPVAGTYIVEIGFAPGDTTQVVSRYMSYDIGGTGAVDADAAFHDASGANAPNTGNISRAQSKALTAVTLTAKYKVSSGTLAFTHRWMRVTPVVIGG